MTTLLLVRHASHDFLGRALAGRTPGVHINERGRSEAQALAERLARAGIGAIYASPRERTQDTAAPLAACLDLAVGVDAHFDEVAFGDWTGRAFADLSDDPQWPVWIAARSAARPPNGETIGEVQSRAVRGLEALCGRHRGETVAIVSHGDVIKAALSHYLGLPLDHMERFDIAPASVSVVVAGEGWSQVKLVNDTGPLVAA